MKRAGGRVYHSKFWDAWQQQMRAPAPQHIAAPQSVAQPAPQSVAQPKKRRARDVAVARGSNSSKKCQHALPDGTRCHKPVAGHPTETLPGGKWRRAH
jgi:hypothetical protein